MVGTINSKKGNGPKNRHVSVEQSKSYTMKQAPACKPSTATASGFVPSRMFLTKGAGRHREKLNSFELALRNAGIAEYNLVRVSSIFPPGCRIISKKDALAKLHTGQILYCVLSENSSDEPNRLLAASLGIAIPADRKHHGYLSEHHSFGQTEKVAGDYAEDLAAEMLATTLGIEFDSDTGYDELREVYKLDGRIINTRNITQSAVGDKNKMWTSVLAAAVFLP